MGQTLDLGKRIELVPMYAHFHDITIALYQQHREAAFLVHTYSRKEGVNEKIESIVETMQVLGGMNRGSDGCLQFSCGDGHELACRRTFLEACKHDPAHRAEPLKLSTLDKRSDRQISVSLNQGQYQVTADGDEKGKSRRVDVIVNGLKKLGDMRGIEGYPDQVAFPCGQSHDELVGLLLVRAPNVRAIAREEELMAARGVLSSPSQQR